jgi:hypothetical protein
MQIYSYCRSFLDVLDMLLRITPQGQGFRQIGVDLSDI